MVLLLLLFTSIISLFGFDFFFVCSFWIYCARAFFSFASVFISILWIFRWCTLVSNGGIERSKLFLPRSRSPIKISFFFAPKKQKNFCFHFVVLHFSLCYDSGEIVLSTPQSMCLNLSVLCVWVSYQEIMLQLFSISLLYFIFIIRSRVLRRKKSET